MGSFVIAGDPDARVSVKRPKPRILYVVEYMIRDRGIPAARRIQQIAYHRQVCRPSGSRRDQSPRRSGVFRARAHRIILIIFLLLLILFLIVIVILILL